ncbi:hypothetical protein ACTWQN_01700 [Saccharopolyspora sp. 5N708]
MGVESLEAAIRRVGSPVELLRNSAVRPHTFPVAPELTNWRSEQQAWRTSCALFDQESGWIPTAVPAISGPEMREYREWGEQPNSGKPAVERHRQVEIRATVAPAPYVREVRDSYRKS